MAGSSSRVNIVLDEERALKLRRLADERLCLVCGVHITGKASKVYCGDACRWAARWAA